VHAEKALNTLVRLCTHGKTENIRLSAANSLLDRGFGKPLAVIHATSSDPRSLTDAELLAIIGAVRTIEGEATDVSPVLELPALPKP
jgi:hypothetical protein